LAHGDPFLDSGKMIYIGVLLIGVIIGAVIANQIVDPFLYKNQSSDFNAMVQLAERLDSRNDELYSCLTEHAIDPNSCD